MSDEVLASTERARSRLQVGPAWVGTDDLVFTRPDGRPLNPSHVSKAFAKMVRTADVPAVRLHDSTRHTHCSILLKRGMNVRAVADRLGHSSPAFTLKTYAHTLEGENAKAVATLDEALRTANGPARATEGVQ